MFFFSLFMVDFKQFAERFKGKRVLVIGDVMLDIFSYGEVSRISQEAPVPVLHIKSQNAMPGGASNVAANIAALGGLPILLGVVGNDANKDRLCLELEQRQIATDFLVSSSRTTTVKQRFVSVSHQLLRVDYEVADPISCTEEVQLARLIERYMPESDIVVVSDYAKGVITPKVMSTLKEEALRHNKKLIVDGKVKNKGLFKDVFLIKPNVKEALEMSDLTQISQAGPKLVKDLGANVCITAGPDGIWLFEKSGSSRHIPTKRVAVYDLTGAGDTVVSVIALATACGFSLIESAQLANQIANVVIQKPGTAVVTFEELEQQIIAEVPKGWGKELWIANTSTYCGKKLMLLKGKTCSVHYHDKKDETFYVQSGKVEMSLQDRDGHKQRCVLVAGDKARISPGVLHQFYGLEDSELFEFSTQHFEEDSFRVMPGDSQK